MTIPQASWDNMMSWAFGASAGSATPLNTDRAIYLSNSMNQDQVVAPVAGQLVGANAYFAITSTGLGPGTAIIAPKLLKNGSAWLALDSITGSALQSFMLGGAAYQFAAGDIIKPVFQVQGVALAATGICSLSFGLRFLPN